MKILNWRWLTTPSGGPRLQPSSIWEWFFPKAAKSNFPPHSLLFEIRLFVFEAPIMVHVWSPLLYFAVWAIFVSTMTAFVLAAYTCVLGQVVKFEALYGYGRYSLDEVYSRWILNAVGLVILGGFLI